MTRTATPALRGYQGFHVRLRRAPEAAREARVMARVALAQWGLDAAADTVVLLLSELVGNAVRHAAGPDVRITVDRPADHHLYVAVTDRAPLCLPRIRQASPEDLGGRGLCLVDVHAARWGVDLIGGHSPEAKRVWAEVDVRAGG
ncbi:ATP-binding protein [Streptomyces sp. NPDC002962]|uniref:ATP-binding protein n=1 Tax=Streptomyces sp. NPDC002962 TaxID=3364674 RepID=UPI003696F8C1